MNTTADKLNRLTETKNAIKTAITKKGGAVNDAMPFREYANAIMGIPQEGGGGSGIIDVAELPTDGIDENAVYRVTTSGEVGIYILQADGTIVNFKDNANAQGVGYNTYFVDELPQDMIHTTEEVYHFYILNSTGTVYFNYMGDLVVTMGQLLFGDTEYDRGFATSLEGKPEGAYVLRTESSVHYFIRDNGEWKRISADEQTKSVTLTMPGTLRIKPDEGKLLSAITVFTGFPTVADFISRNTIAFENITEACFVDSQGNNISSLRSFAFANSYVRYAVIPDFVTNLSARVFKDCNQLKQVTFLGKPDDLYANTFEGCHQLTDINVPWSVDDAINANAPWSATNATINYNYTGE